MFNLADFNCTRCCVWAQRIANNIKLSGLRLRKNARTKERGRAGRASKLLKLTRQRGRTFACKGVDLYERTVGDDVSIPLHEYCSLETWKSSNPHLNNSCVNTSSAWNTIITQNERTAYWNLFAESMLKENQRGSTKLLRRQTRQPELHYFPANSSQCYRAGGIRIEFPIKKFSPPALSRRCAGGVAGL